MQPCTIIDQSSDPADHPAAAIQTTSLLSLHTHLAAAISVHASALDALERDTEPSACVHEAVHTLARARGHDRAHRMLLDDPALCIVDAVAADLSRALCDAAMRGALGHAAHGHPWCARVLALMRPRDAGWVEAVLARASRSCAGDGGADVDVDVMAAVWRECRGVTSVVLRPGCAVVRCFAAWMARFGILLPVDGGAGVCKESDSTVVLRLVEEFVLAPKAVVERYTRISAFLDRLSEVRAACAWHPRSLVASSVGSGLAARLRLEVSAWLTHLATYIYVTVIQGGVDLFLRMDGEAVVFEELVARHERFLGDLYYETLVSEKVSRRFRVD